jgi:hypothetical protein
MKTEAALVCAVLAALVVFSFPSCSKAPSPEELKAAVEIVDVSTKWVAKVYEPWPPKLTLVPVISFRVKNVSAKPLNYLNFNGIFKEQEGQENVGDNFLAAIRREPIPPGGTSDVITLKSNFGVEGKSLASFKDNPNWKPYICRLFIQSKGSPHILLGEYPISRTIDFQEPEPVGKEKKEEEKKG